jgi:hypothetical protein
MATIKVSKNTLTKTPLYIGGVDFLDFGPNHKNRNKRNLDFLDSYYWA